MAKKIKDKKLSELTEEEKANLPQIIQHNPSFFKDYISDPFKSTEFYRETVQDPVIGELFEFFDPTGITSWDDVIESYQKEGMSLNTILEGLGALPLIGKVGKVGKLAKKGIDLSTNGKKYRKGLKNLEKYLEKVDPVNLPFNDKYNEITGKAFSHIVRPKNQKQVEKINSKILKYNIANSASSLATPFLTNEEDKDEMKNNKKQYAYGGVGSLAPDVTYDAQQGHLDFMKKYNEALHQNDTLGVIGQSLAGVGGSLLKATGTPVGDLLGGISNIGQAQSMDEIIGMGIQAGGDFLLNKLNSKIGNNLKMDTGGVVPPNDRDENGYYKSRFNFNGINRPIKIKGYSQKDKMKYFVFQDYDDEAMPLESNQRKLYLDTLRKNNPGIEFIDGDTPQYRKLYNDTKWDYEDRYAQTGNWWTGIKGGDKDYFEKRDKHTPNAGQNFDAIELIDLAKNRKVEEYYSPEEIAKYKWFKAKREKANNDPLLFTQMAYGGLVPDVPIEAEGQEMIETPDGLVSEIMGASHENGGVDMSVPEGSKIYSKRLKGPDGKTMAQRKEFRTKHLAKLEKMLEKNPSDKILKSTIEKTRKDFEKQDNEDIAYMQYIQDSKTLANQINGVQSFNTGGKVKPFIINYKGKKEYDPTIFNDKAYTLGLTDSLINGESIDFSNPEHIKSIQKSLGFTGKDVDGVWGPNSFNEYKKLFNVPIVGAKRGLNIDFFKDFLLQKNDNGLPDFKTPNYLNTEKKDYKEFFPTIGDTLGLIGTYRAGTDPLKLTLEQRAGDRPNENHYKDYGLKGIERLENTKKDLEYLFSQAKLNNLSNANSSKALGHNNARGINTLRAMDLAIDAGLNQADNQAYSQYAQQIAGINQALANMENQRDSMVIQGEVQRSENDTRDRDNFYTQLQRDTNTKNQMYQQLGKQINNLKENSFKKNIINQMTRFQVNNDGTISARENIIYNPTEEAILKRGLTVQHTEALLESLAKGEIIYNKNTDTFYNKEGKIIDELSR